MSTVSHKRLNADGLTASYDSAKTLAISPTYDKDSTLFVGGLILSGQPPLYRSTNAGETWEPVGQKQIEHSVTEIILSPTYEQDSTLFVVTSNIVYRSTDGGENWQPFERGSRIRRLNVLALSPKYADDSTLLGGDGNNYGLYRSTDGGETWRSTAAVH